jgi:hypothetical protein
MTWPIYKRSRMRPALMGECDVHETDISQEAVHLVLFVVLIVVSAVSIWLGTGPVVLSP